MMRSLKIFSMILIVFTQDLSSQEVSDIGISGGNTIVLLPSISTSPISEFRFQMNHEYFTSSSLEGLTSLSLTSGFSLNLELYFKASTEDRINTIPLRRIGYGAKLILPFIIDIINQPAVWFESVNGVNNIDNSLFQPKVTHIAAVFNPSIEYLSPTILLGITSTNISDNFFIGAGMAKTISDNFRIGSELTHNYYGINDLRGAVLLNTRVFQNLGIQLMSAYITSKSISSWSVSLGFVVSTSEINFFPKVEETNGNKLVPDFDDLMKSLDDEKNNEKKDNEK